MTKAIVSVKNMLNNLKLLADAEEYEVTFGDGRLNIGNVVVSCESKYSSQTFKVSGQSVKRLIRVFDLLTDQPATIAIDDSGWLYIKEAIM
jgi:hypothetical protein